MGVAAGQFFAHSGGFGSDLPFSAITACRCRATIRSRRWGGRRYPLVFFNAIRVKIRDEGMIRNNALRIALFVMADGTKVVLGLWIKQNVGAKF
jgi:transposase-like protein